MEPDGRSLQHKLQQPEPIHLQLSNGCQCGTEQAAHVCLANSSETEKSSDISSPDDFRYETAEHARYILRSQALIEP